MFEIASSRGALGSAAPSPCQGQIAIGGAFPSTQQRFMRGARVAWTEHAPVGVIRGRSRGSRRVGPEPTAHRRIPIVAQCVRCSHVSSPFMGLMRRTAGNSIIDGQKRWSRLVGRVPRRWGATPAQDRIRK